MRILFFGSLCLLFMSVLRFVPEVQAAGTSYYVSSTGAGSSCTRDNSCSLNTGLNKAQAGDEVVLRDGTYRGQLNTKQDGRAGSPIVIRAENRHKATILNPGTGESNSVNIKHSYITLRGLVIDGQRKGGQGIYILSAYGGGGPVLNDIIVEDNRILNSGLAAFNIKGVRGVIIRHNFIDGTGFNPAVAGGSGFYISAGVTTRAWAFVDGLEIYGNVVRDTTNNTVDYKELARNVYVHHNIFEGHVLVADHGGAGANDGIIRSNGDDAQSGNRFENNIVRNSRSLYIMRFSGNRVDAMKNVFYSIKANSYLNTTDSPGAPMEIRDNTFCNTPSNLGSNVVTKDVRLAGNRFNQPQSECDKEVQRILNEMKNLPGAGNATLPPPSNLRLITSR